jgi:hypothetical protein
MNSPPKAKFLNLALVLVTYLKYIRPLAKISGSAICYAPSNIVTD